jgi:hypothetical protein
MLTSTEKRELELAVLKRKLDRARKRGDTLAIALIEASINQLLETLHRKS